MTQLPTTASELDQLARDFDRNVQRGGLPPLLEPYGKVGRSLRRSLEAGASENKLFDLVLNSFGPDPESLGRFAHRFAARSLFTDQLQEHQRQYQISGLFERPFTFEPLGFSTTELCLGKWLIMIGDDLAQARQTAQRLGQEFKALADGNGADWLRYRDFSFTTQDGDGALRLVRDNWSSLDAALEQATSASLENGFGELRGSKDSLVKLTVWTSGGGFDIGLGDSCWFLLVHPSLASELDNPDSWWR